MLKTKEIRNKFKTLFTDVETNVGEIIELQLKCIENRMDVLDEESRYKDLIALGQEYYEWAHAEDGDNYGFLFLSIIKEN